jgi:hypothetical protein
MTELTVTYYDDLKLRVVRIHLQKTEDIGKQRRRTVMSCGKLPITVVLLMLAMVDVSRAGENSVNLQLRVGSDVYVTGSARTRFIRLHIQNGGSEVVFVDLSLARKAVSVIDRGVNRGRSTAARWDADHGGRVCTGIDDIVALDPGQSVGAVASLPGKVAPGRVAVAVRIEIPTNHVPDLCAAWPKKIVEANGTVLVPEK